LKERGKGRKMGKEQREEGRRKGNGKRRDR
jgi:hypothetical protein